MVPRGPSFGIGSAHAQNAPANRENVRDRACVARRPANSRYPGSRLRSLFQRHEKLVPAPRKVCEFTLHNALRCIVFASTLVATKSVPSRELALILFQRHEESTNDCVASTLVATKSVPSSELALILFQRHEKKARRARNCRPQLPRSRLRSAPSRELALHIKFAPAPREVCESRAAQYVTLRRLRVDACSNATRR